MPALGKQSNGRGTIVRDSVCLVGHPFASNGMGEALRGVFRSLNRCGLELRLRDVYGIHDAGVMNTGPDMRRYLVGNVDSKIDLFVLNGDERDQAFRHLGSDLRPGGYHIAVPFWELSCYPEEWSTELNKYDEVWASSRFIQDALSSAVSRPVIHLPMVAQPLISSFVSRRYFGIPESSYAFLFFFDFSSYINRKNPTGVLDAFERLCALRPFEDLCLLIKVSGQTEHPQGYDSLRKRLEAMADRVLLIDKVQTDNQMKNLVRCCDCFVSLHRSEGFGFGMAEAMYWGKPVIATGYSGNMDYMSDETACLVDFQLIPVGVDEYPHAQGQMWADPDVDQAVYYMVRLVDDHGFGRQVGERASSHIRTHFSHRACGIRYLQRLEAVAAERASERVSG